MVTRVGRNDRVIRVSRWLDEEIDKFISDKKIKIEFPSKRNFVDRAVMSFLEKRGVEFK